MDDATSNRPLGVDCGNPECNSDHVSYERSGIRLSCHTDSCMIFLPSGCCTCYLGGGGDNRG